MHIPKTRILIHLRTNLQSIMKSKPLFIATFFLMLLTGCLTDNAEEKYEKSTIIEPPKGEVAWFPLNGNLTDSTGNNSLIAVAGEHNYTEGILGKALSLNGKDNFIMVSPGYFDTISVVFWLKTSNGIASPNRPVVFDYGNGAVSAALVDGVSGATEMELKQSEFVASTKQMGSENYLNTYYKYSLVYIEATQNQTSFYFKGYKSDGNPKVVKSSYQHTSLLDAATDVIYIGRSSSKTEIQNSFFTGNIDEIHVYNRFLSEEELNYFNTIQPK